MGYFLLGVKRISRKAPATTIVLRVEYRAETGWEPSAAEGARGWGGWWADLPAAGRRPGSGE